jgi:hypothetical protein
VRVLSRTVKAVEGSGQDQGIELAATLETARHEGVGAANRRVRVLEHTIDPGSSEELLVKQRAKSFARVVELEDGMCRFDVLLDPIRATTVRAALDQTAADWIRQRQFDGVDPIAVDVRSTEQIYAQVVTRLAEVFLATSPEQRSAQFTLRSSTPPRSIQMKAGWLRRCTAAWFRVPRSPGRQTLTRTYYTPRMASRCCWTVKKLTANRPRDWPVPRSALRWRSGIGTARIQGAVGRRRGHCTLITRPRTGTAGRPR